MVRRHEGLTTALVRIALLAATGCASEAAALLVAVRSDLVSGTEVAAVQCEMEGAGRVRTFVGGLDLLDAPSVCEFSGLTDGQRALEIALLDSGGRPLVSRPLQVVVRGRTVITIPMGRDCAGIACPDASDASATACLGGRCVSPDCVEGTGAGCDEAACAAPEDCPSTTSSSCGVRACIAGSCFIDGRGACADGLVCDPRVGCISVGSHTCPDGGVVEPDASIATEPCAIDDTCPPDARRFSIGARSYALLTAPRTYSPAGEACARLGMTLARIDDAAENEALFAETGASGTVWLGGSDGTAEGEWRWARGDTLFFVGGAPVGGLYVNWSPGEPNDMTGSEDCLVLWGFFGGQWNDESCSLAYPAVCERE